MGKLSPEQAYVVLRGVGFDRTPAIWLTAAMFGESGFNPRAHALDSDDDSYGLLQINLRGSMRSRLGLFGLSSPNDLFDPWQNARAAFILSGGGKDLRHWGIGTGDARDRNAKRHYAEAKAAADRADSYAPIPEPVDECSEQKTEVAREDPACYSGAPVPHE